MLNARVGRVGFPRRIGARVAIARAPLPLALAGLAIAALALLPIAYLLIRAAGADTPIADLVLRPRTLTVAASTVGLGLIVSAGTVMLGVPLAWLTARTDLPGRRLWAVLVIVPLAIPSYVTGFAFLGFLGPHGVLAALLAPFGVERVPSMSGLPAAALVLTLASYPYVVLATRSALMRADPAVEEAGRLLGDGRLRVFRRVSLPLLAPAVLAGALLATLYALADFGAVSLLGFDSLSRAIHTAYRASFDRSLAAVLALILVGLSLAVVAGEGIVRRRADSYVGRPPRRPPPPIALGRWRWPAAAFCAVVVSLALVVPAGTIGWWLVRGLGQGEPLRLVAAPALASLGTGVAAAGVAVALALPIGLLAARHPSRIAWLAERSTYAAYALPGIVMALAVVFLANNFVPALYQTLLLLVIAYAVRFLPQASGLLRASLVALGPRLEEAGRTLGDGPVVVVRRLTLPLLRPALVAGAALVFLTTVKELPMALILGPIGFDTLATEIWDAASGGFYARAAAPAALLMILSAATVAVLLRAEERTR